MGYLSGYPRVKKILISIRVGYECHLQIKNHLYTRIHQVR
jgi:hypothetical protein